MTLSDYINIEAKNKIKKEIENANGNEVFFRGIPDKNGLVIDVEVIARGNINSVLAIISRLRKNEVIIHNHPSGNLLPSKEDEIISKVYGESGGASYIVNNDVSSMYFIVSLPKKEIINIDKYFGKDGIIISKNDKFEVREEQYKMSKKIENSLNDNKKLIVEAGTGTGKTLAYLIPSIEYSLTNNKKVIISTNTINLQEQLMNKDIPFVKSLVDKDFSFELVKGMGNYICKRKLLNFNTDIAPNDSEEDKKRKTTLKNLKKWDEETETGDKNDLNTEISFDLWEEVNCESDLCNRSSCKYYSECHFFKARKNVREADVLVVNHHMFFADLNIRNEQGFHTEYSILPNYDVVIFDEAHNIENTARTYFSYEISKFQIGKLSGNLHNTRQTKGKHTGAVSRMMEYILENLDSETYFVIDELREEFIDKLNSYYAKTVDVFDEIINVFKNQTKNIEMKYRIDTEKFRKSNIFNNLMKKNKEANKQFSEFIKIYNKLILKIDEYELEDEDGKIFDVKKYFGRLQECHNTMQFILEMNDNNYVYWFTINNTKTNLKFIATPFDISNSLNYELFSKMDNIIFTSATLSVDNNFKYYIESIGLKESELNTEIIKSAFDYEKQMKAYIPTDTLDPNDIDFFDNQLEFLKELIETTEGRCFLLFTSVSSMNYVYNMLQRKIDISKYNFIKQNDYPRHIMIDMFKTLQNPILFGLDSFWEGVDVQGDKLKTVVITKLPFKVPNDPVMEAIFENIEKKGKNAFFEYQIPQAVIKFKQGIGRLIRSKNDTGNIVVLDNRIINKNYGKKFLSELPKSTTYKLTMSDIIEDMNN